MEITVRRIDRNNPPIRCEAEVGDEAARQRRHLTTLHCLDNAHYEVANKNYCGKHAGKVLLELMLGNHPNLRSPPDQTDNDEAIDAVAAQLAVVAINSSNKSRIALKGGGFVQTPASGFIEHHAAHMLKRLKDERQRLRLIAHSSLEVPQQYVGDSSEPIDLPNFLSKSQSP